MNLLFYGQFTISNSIYAIAISLRSKSRSGSSEGKHLNAKFSSHILVHPVGRFCHWTKPSKLLEIRALELLDQESQYMKSNEYRIMPKRP